MKSLQVDPFSTSRLSLESSINLLICQSNLWFHWENQVRSLFRMGKRLFLISGRPIDEQAFGLTVGFQVKKSKPDSRISFFISRINSRGPAFL